MGVAQSARFSHQRQRGYVLIMVLGALALMAFVAARFAARIDTLRTQAATLMEYAQARAAADSALNAGIYWVVTRHGGTGGFGQAPLPVLEADGRPYLLPGGAELRLLDQRGLFPINGGQRQTLARVLRGLGAPSDKIDGLIDVLLDYQDTDNLKRLNGAEAAEYSALGLAPPSNDWLLSLSELRRMPLWREQPELVEAVQRVASIGREGLLNPNTMPRALLKALQPAARPEQLELFWTLRRANAFESSAAVLAATGMNLEGEDYLYHVSDRLRFIVWAPGLPQAYQYNLVLVPGGSTAPWVIQDAQPENRDSISNDPSERKTPFPLQLETEARQP